MAVIGLLVKVMLAFFLMKAIKLEAAVSVHDLQK